MRRLLLGGAACLLLPAAGLADDFVGSALYARLGEVRDAAAAVGTGAAGGRPGCANAPVRQPGGEASFFRKVESVPDRATYGIKGTGRLPDTVFDPARDHVPGPGEPFWKLGPLDRPSVYLGARGPHGIMEAGLSWDRVYGVDGPPRFAFRPFWRTTDGKANQWHNPAVGSPDNVYFRPGERFTMTLQQHADDEFRLDIRGEEPGSWKHFTVVFHQRGFPLRRGKGLYAFRRVNAIDQSSAGPTKTRAVGARWDSVSLLGPKGVFGDSSPLAAERCEEVWSEAAAAQTGVFSVDGPDPSGGETIDITP